MKKLLKTLISSLAVVFVFFGIIYAQSVPDWVSTPTFKKGSNVYYVGMGIDKDKVVARNKAIEDIKSKVVESILVEITSEAKKEMLITSDESNVEVVNKLSSEVSTKGKARIFVPTPESEYSFQDKSGNYIVYLLTKYPESKINEERARIEQIYKDMIRSVDKFIEEGDNYAKEGKLINAVISYTIAAKNSLDVEERKMNYPEIIKKIDDILSRVSVEVVGGNNKNVTVGDAGEVKFGVFYNTEGNKIPVKDVNLIFRVVEGGADISTSGTTGEDGMAICSVNKVLRFENKKLTIRAFPNIDFSGLASINQDTRRDASKLIGKTRLIFAEASWYMSMAKSQKAAIIALVEKDGKYYYDKKLSSSLSSYVIKKGYKTSSVQMSKEVSGDTYDDFSKFVKNSNLVLVKVSEPIEKNVDFGGDEKVVRVISSVTVEIYDESGNLLNSESFNITSSSKDNFESNLSKNIGKKIEEINF